MPAPRRGSGPRVALVTGGAGGIGRATAVGLATEGCAVVVADIDADGGSATVDACASAGGSARFVRCDVTDVDAVDALVAGIVADQGGLDCAVNNAGTSGRYALTADADDATWNAVVGLNLTATFLCIRAEIRAMLACGGGAIVNVASGAGLVGFPGLGAYVASKHGVVGLTKAAALEYAGSGIRVNCVCPGSTRTPMLENFMGNDPEVERRMVAAQPNARLAEPEEIAAAVLWLCSDAASFAVGAVLAIDGGATAQ